MAEKRMFSRSVIDSDNFLDMPISARLLYYDLGMRADDDGFVNAPKKITRISGATPDDLKILAQRGFIIPFRSGIIVITHWRIHNYIPKDRYHETSFQNEMKMLTVLENREYSLNNVYGTDTECIQPVYKSDTQNRREEFRVSKDNDSCSEPVTSSAPDVPALILNDGTEWFPTKEDLEGWQHLYIGVNVVRELGRMREWCKSNPTRRKTRKGVRRFVQSWLDREQNNVRKGDSNTGGNKFNNFEQNHYDFDQLEKDILGE